MTDKQIDYSKTLIRCSAIGSIMGNPKGSITEKQLIKLAELQEKAKAGTLTDKQVEAIQELMEKQDLANELAPGAKKYLKTAYCIEKYHRVPDIQTKEMIKGTTAEDGAIQLYSFVEDKPYLKNKQQLANDFICGTPDLFTEDLSEVIDIKCSWSLFTFINNIGSPMSMMYYAQLQGYMALTEASTGVLAYCLVSAPPEMVEDEKRRLFYRLQCVTDDDPRYLAKVKTIERNMIFEDIPQADRVLKFEISRDDEFIDKVYQKVGKCREYISSFANDHQFFIKGNRKLMQKGEPLAQEEVNEVST